jgi:putative ABC transport system permease protein
MRVPFFVLMAAREVRASWQRMVFFFICVAIGVCAIVTLRSIVQNVRAAIVGQARTLLGADVVISTSRPWEPKTREEIEARIAHYPVVARSELIETSTMARADEGTQGAARMVEVLAVDPSFPLYGAVKMGPESGGGYEPSLLTGGGVLVRPELLTLLGVRVGDVLLLGGQPFSIRGTVLEEPGSRASAFSLGPKVVVARRDLEASGLLAFGSRARYRLLLRIGGEAAAGRLAQDIREHFADRFVSTRWYRRTEEAIGEDLQRAEDYLSLVGFVIVVLGGVGVWSVTRVFLQQRLRAIAVLKCLGATTRQVLATYLLQTLLLGLTGGVVGVALAALALAAVPDRVVSLVPGARIALTGPAVLQGVAVGGLVSMLFALVPLLDVRRIRPLILLREGLSETRPARFDAAKGVAVGVLLVLLGAVAVWQAGDWRTGLTVLVGLIVLAGVLTAAGMGVVRLTAPLAASRRFAVRHGVLSLRRPGNQTRVILLAVGLGAFFVLGVRLIQIGLLEAIRLEITDESPDMFLLDIQSDQLELMARTAASAGARAPKLVPVLRARVVGVRGELVNLENYEDVRGRGSLGREYVVTFREGLEENETLIEGAWPPATAGALPAVSIERSLRDRFELRLGDVMRFDVMGRLMEARVASVRDVDWGRARSGGFMFVFEPQAFAGAPATYIGFMKAPDDAASRARLQRDIAGALPNVSVIDARELFARAREIVASVSLGVTIVGLVALLAGVLILAGAVAMTRFQRIYEAAIFRTLGATTRALSAMLAFEYGLLGLLAGSIAAGGAMVLAWVVSTRLLDIRWTPAPATAAAGVILTGVLVLVVGVAASAEVLRQKPLGTLRSE